MKLDPNNWNLKYAIFDKNINVSVLKLPEDEFTIYPNPARK